MEKLYSLVQTDDSRKADLYIRGQSSHSALKSALHKDEILDFCTYFNSISIKKWRQYTTIQQVVLELNVKGSFELTVSMYSPAGEQILVQEKINGPIYRKTWHIDELSGDIAGFSLRALEDGVQCCGGAYYGEFAQWQEQKIGIGICTFKREEYVFRTLRALEQFKVTNPWLQVLVVDNGRTLKEYDKDGIRIIHNRNFGGSGGFTRAMIEYVDKDQVEYVLLMDDDIVLEPSALERSHSLLCGLKEEYKDSFLSGAMLTMEKPVIQHENTAYWSKFISEVVNKGLDLSAIDNLVKNESTKKHQNQYAGWWYCCIPLERIKKIGYPLPVFIKSDDMEYGIRNRHELLTLNGIGVWHETFSKKMSQTIRFFSDRNSFILNHYVDGCGLGTLLLAILGRLYKRGKKRDFASIQILSFALQDYFNGFAKIVSKGADLKMAEVTELTKMSPQIKNYINIFAYIIKIILNYQSIDTSYKAFRHQNLRTSVFWKRYLGIK